MDRDQALSETEHRAPGASPESSRWIDAWPLAVVLGLSAAAWAVIFIAVSPWQQNFPLGDDWAFSHTFFDLLAGRGLNYRQFAAMPQIGQWLWALPFYAVFRENHLGLRLSAIVLGWLGLAAAYDLFGQAGLSRKAAGFLMAVLGLNPIWFVLQGTFMTDVPALSFSLIALASYGRASRAGAKWLWPATAAATLGVATRQNAVVVPLVAAILIWAQPVLRRSLSWIAAILIPIAVAMGTHVWFVNRTDILPPVFEPQPPHIALIFPFLILHTCGLMCLPAVALNPWPRSWKLLLGSIAAMFAMALYWAGNHLSIPSFDKRSFFPYMIPILGPYGPFSSHFQVGSGPLLLPIPVRQVLSVLGCIGGGYLLARAIEALRDRERADPLLWFTGLQVPLLFFAPSLYDRYFLVLLPGALWLLVRKRDVTQVVMPWRLAGTVGIAVSTAFSVCYMHDWLSWNRARWDLGRKAIDRRISTSDIEGGFEWDGWYAPSPRQLPVLTIMPPDRMVLQFTRGNFANVTGRYAIGFERYRDEWSEVVPYGIVRDQEECSIWTNPGRQRLLFLEDRRFGGDNTPKP